jgi:hypothetical protein
MCCHYIIVIISPFTNHFTAGVILEIQAEITVYCDTCTREPYFSVSINPENIRFLHFTKKVLSVVNVRWWVAILILFISFKCVLAYCLLTYKYIYSIYYLHNFIQPDLIPAHAKQLLPKTRI